MKRYSDRRDVAQPDWFDSLTPAGKVVLGALVVAGIALLALAIGTIETWGYPS